MSRRLIVRAEAEFDIAEAAVWYEGREPGLGLEVIAEIRAAIQHALENPLGYLRLRRDPHVRRVLVRRFPYRVFYILDRTRSSSLASSMPGDTTVNGNNAYEFDFERGSTAA